MEQFKYDPENIFEDDKSYPNPKSGAEARTMLSKPLKQIRDFINTLVNNLYSRNEVNQLIADAQFKSGSADMFKSEYDKDGDGIVDNAKKVNGHTVDADVPADAVFKYGVATEDADGLMSAADHAKLKTIPKYYIGGTFVEPADMQVGDIFLEVEE